MQKSFGGTPHGSFRSTTNSLKGCLFEALRQAQDKLREKSDGKASGSVESMFLLGTEGHCFTRFLP